MNRRHRFLACSISLLAAAATGLRAESLGGVPVGPADRDAAMKAYAACLSKAGGDASCRALRSRVVALLAEDLRILGTAPGRRAVPMLVAELEAREPELRAAAADALGIAGATKAETPVLLAALNDPVPAVRASASASLAVSKDPVGEAAVARFVRVGYVRSMRPQTAPSVQALEVPVYPGAVYHFGTSDPSAQRWEFSTSDPGAKVVEFYKAKAKKGPLSTADLQKAYGGRSMMDEAKRDAEAGGDESGDSDMPSAADMAKGMAMAQQLMKDMAGKSPEEMQKGLMAGAAATSTPLPIERYEKVESYGTPRFFVLEEATFLGAVRPLRYVVVYEDKVFGKTGFAVLRVNQ